MQPIFKQFISSFLLLGFLAISGCIGERGHAPVYGPGESENDDGTLNINLKNPNELPQLERAIYELVNQHRANIGLSELAWSNTVAKQCRNHSVNMALGFVSYGHQGFQERIVTIRSNFPGSFGVENIARHHSSNELAEKIFAKWISSSESRLSIEGDFQRTGVGVAKNANEIFYFTQIIIRQDDLN